MTGTAESSASADSKNHADTERKRRPVFVMGCHRSGTNLLYDTLLSAGGFAVYRGYLPIYEILLPRFGSLENPRNREKLVETWMLSKGFKRAGLDTGPLSSKLLAECRSGGDFIRIIMDEIADSQGVQRWALYDPDSVLNMARIKKDLREPLFVHIIRDGRDVALSLTKMGGFRPFPWSRRRRGLLETALYWDWTVHQGRRYGSQIPADYIEIHYEELVTQPRTVLARLGDFLDHDLDYDRIHATGLGRLRESNSSFRGDEKEARNPVNRWKEKLSHPQAAALEALIGATLQEFSYPLTVDPAERRVGFWWKCLASVYPHFLSTKHWLKLSTPVGRFADLSALELPDGASDAD
ncbi:MAG TPA: sulfotransferase [Candidatus Dormibacteraeota bacterium]|jgi:LPS sulfotransferase NodH|nr:sulfotransferase [Candidatus Dormibacteraeota bacterium]